MFFLQATIGAFGKIHASAQLAQFRHITLVLANLHWVPIELRIEFEILVITYKTLHGLAPTYFKDLPQRYLPPLDFRSAKKNLLVVPAFNRISYGRRALLLRRVSGTVFHRISGMLNHWTFKKDV